MLPIDLVLSNPCPKCKAKIGQCCFSTHYDSYKFVYYKQSFGRSKYQHSARNKLVKNEVNNENSKR